jgi:hypothetical protein
MTTSKESKNSNKKERRGVSSGFIRAVQQSSTQSKGK